MTEQVYTGIIAQRDAIFTLWRWLDRLFLLNFCLASRYYKLLSSFPVTVSHPGHVTVCELKTSSLANADISKGVVRLFS